MLSHCVLIWKLLLSTHNLCRGSLVGRRQSWRHSSSPASASCVTRDKSLATSEHHVSPLIKSPMTVSSLHPMHSFLKCSEWDDKWESPLKAKSGLVTLSKYKMYILYKGVRHSFADLLSLKKEERKKMGRKKKQNLNSFYFQLKFLSMRLDLTLSDKCLLLATGLLFCAQICSDSHKW